MHAKHPRLLALLTVAALVGGLVAVPAASATPIHRDLYVALTPPATNGGTCEAPDYNTIAAAVAAAITGDTIHLCAGTYALGATVAVTKDLSFVGAGANMTIVDGGGAVQLFSAPGRYLTFASLALRNGAAGAGNGGAISAARVSIDNSVLSGNTAAGGGAIYTVGGVGSPAVSVNASIFSSNGGSTTFDGGAIYAQGGDVSVATSLFEGNAATDTSVPAAPTEGAGGAILAASATVTGSMFRQNMATLHGGALLADTISVSGSTFMDNQAVGAPPSPGYGGALWGTTVNATDSSFIDNDAAGGGAIGTAGAGTATATGSVFTGNGHDATYGGAIYATGGAVVTANSTFASNHGLLGGALMAGTTVTATNVTFADNGATGAYGSAILASGGTLTNTILASGVGEAQCWAPGAFTDGGGDFSTDASCGFTQPSSQVVTAAQLALGPLADNGGPTDTMALGWSSVAIDAGVDAACGTAPVNGVDQRGISRPQGIHCDSGAYEYVFSAVAITGFSPASGPVGTVVTITGTGFVKVSGVTFGGRAAAFTVVSPTQIRAVVPTGAGSGPIAVTASGGSATSAQPFTVTLAPMLLGFSPASGRAGSLVTITGANLGYTRAVTIGGRSATFSVRTPAIVVATVPVGAVTGRIVVTGTYGSATSATSFFVLP